MTSTDKIEVEGVVVKTLPNTLFEVKLDSENCKDHIVLAYLAGKMRTNYITILPGDRVKLEISTYDLAKGRITYRYK